MPAEGIQPVATEKPTMHGENQQPENGAVAAQTLPPRPINEIVRLLTEIRDEVRTIKEKRRSAPHTPHKKKREVRPSPVTDARTREGIAVPTLDEVKAYAATASIGDDVADDFYTYFDGVGWQHKGSMICNWRAMLKAWQRARKRFAARDAAITAHIDAKMDEREKKREASIATRRRPINWIGCTEEEKKEFCDGLA